ncbi:polysaccharide deacetylase family protein [Geodermatophilus sp. SYSU D00779]
MVPLAATLLTLGWLRYTQGLDEVSEAAPGANLFPAVTTVGTEATGGWRVGHSRDADVSLRTVQGSITDHALRVEVPRYASGDVTLTSPRVPVSPDQSYLFKAYTSGGPPAFTLLAHYSYQDGSDRLVALEDHPEHRLPWSTVSGAFSSDDDVVAVQYVFRLASAGTFDVDGAYLVPAHDVHVDPAPPTAPNLIPNAELAVQNGTSPRQWSPYRSGESIVDFQQGRDDEGPFLETRITDYRSGEAKWQYEPIAVRPDQHLRFTATYRSDQPVDVVAEFQDADGGHRFIYLDTVLPAGEWTQIEEYVQVPAEAATLMTTIVSHGDGSTAVRDQALVDVSRPGAPHWDRPLVSITFDDGWQSAYSRAVPRLEQYGYAGTFYVNPATIETPDFMTAAELEALDREGHDVALHGYEHVDLTAISARRIDEQLRRGQESLAQAGLPTEHLATPHGRSDAQVEWYARKYVQTLRGTETGINTRQNLDPYDLKVLYLDKETTPEALSEALAETQRSHGWLILVYHQIGPASSDDGDRRTVFADALTTHLDLIRDSGIRVEPVSEAFSEVTKS